MTATSTGPIPQPTTHRCVCQGTPLPGGMCPSTCLLAWTAEQPERRR